MNGSEWLDSFIRGTSGAASVKPPFMGERGLCTFELQWDWWTVPHGTLWPCNATLPEYQWPQHGFA